MSSDEFKLGTSQDTPKTTFNDVAGCDEAKVELQEIVDFLKHPDKYKKFGGGPNHPTPIHVCILMRLAFWKCLFVN